MTQVNGEVPESKVLAIDELAWSCLGTLRKLSRVVPAEEGYMVEAMILRREGSDYEDNLLVAVAEKLKAAAVVAFSPEQKGAGCAASKGALWKSICMSLS